MPKPRVDFIIVLILVHGYIGVAPKYFMWLHAGLIGVGVGEGRLYMIFSDVLCIPIVWYGESASYQRSADRKVQEPDIVICKADGKFDRRDGKTDGNVLD
jgi:hypothetical protein